MSHSHAHGPANRGGVVRTTAAPVFVCEPPSARAGLVVVHGPEGITAGLEAGLRMAAARGLLAVAPFLYYRDGGPEYPRPDEASSAYARLGDDDLDIDIDAATRYVTGRLAPGAPVVIAAVGPSARPVSRALGRHRYAADAVVDAGGPAAPHGGTPHDDWPTAVTRLLADLPAAV